MKELDLHSPIRLNGCLIMCGDIFNCLHTHISGTMLSVKNCRQAEHIIKKTPWTLVRKRTIPTDRPPLVDEI
jgi:hypothetical protein